MEDDFGPELLITFNIELRAMRFIGNMLVPSIIVLEAALARGDESTDDGVELTFSKWRYFFDNLVTRSIIFSKDNDAAIDMLLEDGVSRVSNIFVLTPEEPSDETLAALFQAKMNALANGQLYVASISISSDNLHGVSFTLMGDHTSYLPATIDEYLGGESFWDKPWWYRDDASTLDVLKTTEDAKAPTWAYSLDFLDRTKTGKTTIITKPSFRPTVIDGGKPDTPKE